MASSSSPSEWSWGQLVAAMVSAPPEPLSSTSDELLQSLVVAEDAPGAKEASPFEATKPLADHEALSLPTILLLDFGVDLGGLLSSETACNSSIDVPYTSLLPGPAPPPPKMRQLASPITTGSLAGLALPASAAAGAAANGGALPAPTATVSSDGGDDDGYTEAFSRQPDEQTCRFCSTEFTDPLCFIQHLRDRHKVELKTVFAPGKCYFADCTNQREKWTMYYIEQHLRHHFTARRFVCASCAQRFWTKKDWTSHTQHRICRHCNQPINCVYSKHKMVCVARASKAAKPAQTSSS